MTALRPGQSPPPVRRPMRIERNPMHKRILRGCRLSAVMSEHQHLRLWAGAAGAGALAIGAALAERRHMRRIASDPESAVLQRPPHGRPLSVVSADGTKLHG